MGWSHCMYIAYFDETGDDGYPNYSSPLFVLSAIYLHYLNWQPIFHQIQSFRRELKKSFNFPVRTELHTRPFLLNKNPYRNFGLTDQYRIKLIDLFCDLISGLDIKIINVVIVKPRIQNINYQVLDTAFKYSIQRIENDLQPDKNPGAKFIIITDPGRVGKMRKTSRRIQRLNFIPSKFGSESYRREISTLIEDPLPKDSRESYFIQLVDLVSFIVYMHSLSVTGTGQISNRLSMLITPDQISNWMNKLKSKFNLQASQRDPYGIVYHPY